MNCHRVVSLIGAFLVAGAAAQGASEDAAKIVAVEHLNKGTALVQEGKLAPAEHEFDLAIISYPAGSALYGARGKVRYARNNYQGAIQDLDLYLSTSPDDREMLLVRGIAKSLLKPEDVLGACADFLRVRKQARELGMEKYCHGQPGWDSEE